MPSRKSLYLSSKTDSGKTEEEKNSNSKNLDDKNSSKQNSSSKLGSSGVHYIFGNNLSQSENKNSSYKSELVLSN